MEFYQLAPKSQDSFNKNKVLQLFLKSMLGFQHKDKLQTFCKDMKIWSDRIDDELEPLNQEAIKNPPQHIPYSPWGQRIDQIQMPKSWSRFQEIAAEEALIATAYNKTFEEHSRLYQFVKLFLFHPSSSFFTCPLAMTDGVVKCLSLLGEGKMAQEALQKMTSTNPKEFVTCGQWMTERQGGSDVSESGTEARLENNNYHIYGSKWFTSDVVSQYAAILARTDKQAGAKGLSLFLMKIKDENGNHNRIQIRRLKDKLGTKVLPTAEVDLLGTPAVLIGEKHQGIKNVSHILNITRLYNAICAMAQPQRAYELALDYATKRKSFGSYLKDHPLHLETLSQIQSTLAGGLSFVLHSSSLLGLTETSQEASKASKHNTLLRLLIPLGKIVTGKMSVQLSSECLESIGGAGYIEDTGLPLHLRDSQVFSLWEGTSNILSLDVLRVLNKHADVLSIYEEDIKKRVEQAKDFPQAQNILDSLTKIQQFLSKTKDRQILEASAREIAFSLFYTYAASLMLGHALWAKQNNEEWFLTVASKFCSQKLFFCTSKTPQSLKQTQNSLF